ncbi:C-factor isoform X1 [Harmonia axyridis]|uniref:C-factor isoform X1 n=1 Tax=Harmonia axyridis TaxID=115357 RepID=UPI001E274E44|nr:C-factor isoform X1 [Harmonia axyridis]
MKSILVTGSNRGLGLGLIKRIVTQDIQPKYIIGTCRDIEKAKDLHQIAALHPNVRILNLDIRNTETFENFSREVENIVKDDGLNLLINNAGYSPKSTRILFLKTEQLTETFQTNVIGPIMLTKALLPLLKKGAENSQKKFSAESAVINMTSILGSIGLNKEGGLYPYRCSKAALNMATKSLSLDLKKDGILATALHPGWVKTDMGGPGAPLSVDESISHIMNFIENLNENHNGGFYQYDGKSLEW